MAPAETHRIPVLFDADCGLCTRTAGILRRLDRRRNLELVPFDEARRRGLADELTPEDFQASFHVVFPQRTLSGPEAIPEVLRLLPGGRWPAWWIRRSPFLSSVVERGYRWVANNRHRLGGRGCNCERPPATSNFHPPP